MVEKINDAVNLLKKEFFNLGESVEFSEDKKNNLFFWYGDKTLELMRGINSYEVRLFEKANENTYKILGTLIAMKDGLYYVEGQINEELLSSSKLFDEEAARGIINKLK